MSASMIIEAETLAESFGLGTWKRPERLMVTSQATFLVAAGGTGGHVIPALEVARELRTLGHECVFVGTPRGLENRLVPPQGFRLELLKIGALNHVPVWQKMETLLRLPLALVHASSLLDRIRPAAVLSLGGYAAGPVMLSAIARDVPLLILEPNALPGLAHRLAGPFSTCALLGFEQAGRYFPAQRWEVSGVPVRKEFFGLPRKAHRRPFQVLITGGSQGSQRLNQAAVEALPILAARGRLAELRFTHQTGAKEYNGVRSAYALHEAEADVTPFIDDMPRAFRDADLVICRAGASAIGELAAAGKASILIPFPFAADQHQLRNAEAMQSAGAARLALDNEWTGTRFAAEMERLAGSPRVIESMEDAALQLARPDAARRVAGRLVKIAGRRGAVSKVH